VSIFGDRVAVHYNETEGEEFHTDSLGSDTGSKKDTSEAIEDRREKV
jgi:hypothetical protein